MPLHGEVGINCERGATTENKSVGGKHMGYGVYVDDCVCYLTRHDYPSLVVGESLGILYHYHRPLNLGLFTVHFTVVGNNFI